MRKVRVAVAASVAAAALAVPMISSTPALADISGTYNLDSSDYGAHSSTTVTWQSATTVLVSVHQCDTKADGYAPRAKVIARNYLDKVMIDDDWGGGNGTCQDIIASYDSTADTLGVPLDLVEINQCNHGLNNCRYIRIANPYKG